MKVSHESPVSILELSRGYNDFDYCLVHLLDQIPEYKQFYSSARTIYNREVLLDNSIFELGRAFDSREFWVKIKEIQPNMFIVPDVLEDYQGTVESYKRFIHYIQDIKETFQTKAIGAVQGKTWQDLTECYKFIADNADMVAISFDFSYYQTVGYGRTQLERWCSGRQRFIQDYKK
jgi:hypothetical protein